MNKKIVISLLVGCMTFGQVCPAAPSIRSNLFVVLKELFKSVRNIFPVALNKQKTNESQKKFDELGKNWNQIGELKVHKEPQRLSVEAQELGVKAFFTLSPKDALSSANENLKSLYQRREQLRTSLKSYGYKDPVMSEIKDCPALVADSESSLEALARGSNDLKREEANYAASIIINWYRILEYDIKVCEEALHKASEMESLKQKRIDPIFGKGQKLGSMLGEMQTNAVTRDLRFDRLKREHEKQNNFNFHNQRFVFPELLKIDRQNKANEQDPKFRCFEKMEKNS